jgi:diacylglycerol kinase family enzyme
LYTYIRNINSSNPLTETLQARIQAEIKKLHISGDILEFDSEKSLHSLLSQIDASTTNTLVVIGNDKDLEIMIGQLGSLKDDLAIGYLPITESRIAKSLNIKDWLSAAEALAQRKIKEISLYSIGGRYFLSNTQLEFEKGRSKHPISILIDGNLSLSLPHSKVILENSSQQQYQSNKPLLVTAYAIKDSNQTSAEKIFKIIHSKVKKTDELESEQILHISARSIKIQSENIIRDNLGRLYKNSITVGKNHKTIRLITKKATRA